MADNPETKNCKFYQTEKFKKLQEKWKKKLEDSGFEDIEQPNHFESDTSDCSLKEWSSTRHLQGKGLEPEYIQSQTEYYRVAGQFLWEHKFKNATEKTIWELHSNGKSIRKIVRELKHRRTRKLGSSTLNKRTVHEKIQELAKIMREKYISE